MHTPGPWKIQELSKLDGEYVIFTGGQSSEDADAHVALACGGLGHYDEGGDDCGCHESKANALLIAASPELLEQLEHLVEYLQFHVADGSADWDACLPEHKSVIADAQAVIDKAKGR